MIRPDIGRRGLAAAVLIAACLGPCGAARAQCANAWLPDGGVEGAGAPLGALAAWDPDGSGPQGEVVVASGGMELGGLQISGPAVFDPAIGSWAELGTGPSSPAKDFAVDAAGDLIVGGQALAGGLIVRGVARWDGSAWHALGSGFTNTNADVRAVEVLQNGDIVAGGRFTMAGTTAVTNVARWDGSSWQPMAAGIGSEVSDVLVLPSGELYACTDDIGPDEVLQWTGTAWSCIGTATSGGGFRRLGVLAEGDLVVGGAFTTIDGNPLDRVARWNGAAWHGLGAGLDQTVEDLTLLPGGDLVVTGRFQTAGTIAADRIARWDGVAWSEFATGTGLDDRGTAVAALQTGEAILAGSFTTVGPIAARRLAWWTGSAWQPVGAGFGLDDLVYAIAALPDGDLVAAGTFTMAGTTPVTRLARWDGGTWHPFGSPDDFVNGLHALPGGDLVATGSFTTIGGIAANRIARWDGSGWHPFGAGLPLAAASVGALPNGDVIAATSLNLRRWNGSWWQVITPGTNSPIRTTAVLPNGDVVIGGQFFAVGSQAITGIARWDGSAWHSLAGAAPFRVNALQVLPNGDLVAGGLFAFQAGGSNAANIARWDGAAWHALGSGTDASVSTLGLLPDGDLAVGGAFTTAGGLTVNRIARWDGVTWAPLGGGSPLGANGTPQGFAALKNGDFAAGGFFTEMGGAASNHLAFLRSSCPARADPIATACVGTTGPLALVPRTLPWIGTTFASTATGFGPDPLALALVGFQSPNTPLAALHPLGNVNCDLLASPDAALFLLPAAGASGYAFGIPHDPAFAGAVLFHQFLQAELDPQGTPVALSGSNGLRLTIGAF